MSLEKRVFNSVKIIFVGPTGAGKTELVECLREEENRREFKDEYVPTVGPGCVARTFKKLQYLFWDTSADSTLNRYSGDVLLNDATVCILCVDLTKTLDADQLSLFIKAIKQRTDPTVEIIMVGTKSDRAPKGIHKELMALNLMDEGKVSKRIVTSAKNRDHKSIHNLLELIEISAEKQLELKPSPSDNVLILRKIKKYMETELVPVETSVLDLPRLVRAFQSGIHWFEPFISKLMGGGVKRKNFQQTLVGKGFLNYCNRVDRFIMQRKKRAHIKTFGIYEIIEEYENKPNPTKLNNILLQIKTIARAALNNPKTLRDTKAVLFYKKILADEFFEDEIVEKEGGPEVVNEN